MHGEATDVTRVRLSVFRSMLKKHDIDVPKEYVIGATYHLPETTRLATLDLLKLKERPSCIIHQGVSDTDQSVMQTGHCIGTYIHGFLDNAPVIDYLLSEKGTVNSEKLDTALSYADFKEEQYDKLAAHVRQYVDIDKIYEILRY